MRHNRSTRPEDCEFHTGQPQTVPARDSELAFLFGRAEEVAVALCVYGDDLDPAEMTALIGVEPTHSHRKGDRLELRSPVAATGAWIREVRRTELIDVDEMFAELLDGVSADAALWIHLARRLDVRFDLAVHTDTGCTLNLKPETLRAISERSGALQVYIQAYGDAA